MKPHTAAAILAVVDAHGLPRTKEKAEPVIQAWLRSHDAKLDRWGNYHLSDGKRVKFQERVVRVEEKTQYGWVARQSSSYVDMALILTKKASEAAGRGDVLQKAVKTRSTRKAASERGAVARKAVYEVKNGPGYYVTNGYVGGGMSLKMRVADHAKPFSNLDDAIAMAERKYRELVGMKFHYLLPVQVVKTEDRFHAEHPVAAVLGKKPESVYWQDGRKIEHENPNQVKLPGMAKGRIHSAQAVRGWVHYGDEKHHPMQTVSFDGSKAKLDKILREARRGGTPARFQPDDGHCCGLSTGTHARAHVGTIQHSVPNLDAMSKSELARFAAAYSTPTEEKAVALVGKSVRSPVKVAQLASKYAHAKKLAMGLREKGKIQEAMVYEDRCEGFYNNMPASVRW